MTGTDAIDGAAQGLVARTFALLARTRKAPGFHPHGVPAAGTLDVVDPASALAAALGTESRPVVARLSRGAGLPGPLPDFLGVALRTTSDVGPFDLLMTTVGPGRFGSLLLAPSPRWTARRYSTLLPYVSPRGRVLIGLRPSAEVTASSEVGEAHDAIASTGLELDVVERAGFGPWRVVGHLRLDEADDVDLPDAFDPVINTHPALHMAPFLTGIRAAAYAGSRRGRGPRRGRPS